MGCLVIAEVGMAHDGSLSLAHAYIDAIATTGADAVKFQTHIAEAESTRAEPWRASPHWCQDACRYDYWQRTEFTFAQWFDLRAHALDKGLRFLSSPFSLEAVSLLHNIGMDWWKIASGEVTNLPMLERIAELKQPVLISTGLCTTAELDQARALFPWQDVTLLACATAYPCPPDVVPIRQMQMLGQQYPCKVGLSDHSGTIYPSLIAAWLHADAVEVHVTLNRQMGGIDALASVTIDDLKRLVEGVRMVPWYHLGHQADTSAMRELFLRKVVNGRTLKKGEANG